MLFPISNLGNLSSTVTHPVIVRASTTGAPFPKALLKDCLATNIGVNIQLRRDRTTGTTVLVLHTTLNPFYLFGISRGPAEVAPPVYGAVAELAAEGMGRVDGGCECEKEGCVVHVVVGLLLKLFCGDRDDDGI